MVVFILGGVKGGKSMFAQFFAKHISLEAPLYYIATMIPYDSEDNKRIERHKHDREGWGFITIEEHYSINNAIDQIPKGSTIMIDSITAYVQNNMFDESRLYPGIDELVRDIHTIENDDYNFVIVSDYIFSDAIKYSETVNAYLEALGRIHIEIAEISDIVVECIYSNMSIKKNLQDYDINQILNDYLTRFDYLLYHDI